eukprot:CAMPEP_0114996736 /NCGR_PEP_ID=MMETSP0216-20121206/14494_1 /TAXON_ID=223996 /ORGANISM="Protocruzia adherens, Strain Boccale" /LENGTH=359 /DNA_ID=CAMNT_0002361009 /DNA_START=532 /DNA_END=1611 /DNA_ORIENTATION=-
MEFDLDEINSEIEKREVKEDVYNTTIDVVVSFGQDEKELFQAVKAFRFDSGDLSIPSIVTQLKKVGYPVETAMVSFYAHEQGLYVHCGCDPLPHTALIPKDSIERGRVTLKFRGGHRADTATSNNNSTTTNPTSAPSNSRGGSGRRTKERKIGYIIEKVALWRKLYNGIHGPCGETIRYSLEESAQKVGISKKSLDDYLLQLRFGRKYGFNFNEHRNDKVGVLRAHVKRCKQKDLVKKGSAASSESCHSEEEVESEGARLSDESSQVDRVNSGNLQDALESLNEDIIENDTIPQKIEESEVIMPLRSSFLNASQALNGNYGFKSGMVVDDLTSTQLVKASSGSINDQFSVGPVIPAFSA